MNLQKCTLLPFAEHNELNVSREGKLTEGKFVGEGLGLHNVLDSHDVRNSCEEDVAHLWRNSMLGTHLSRRVDPLAHWSQLSRALCRWKVGEPQKRGLLLNFLEQKGSC